MYKRQADSRRQCHERGEILQAIKAGSIAEQRVIELGEIEADPKRGRTNDTQISVADLTGVAVQDIMIATAVMEALG